MRLGHEVGLLVLVPGPVDLGAASPSAFSVQSVLSLRCGVVGDHRGGQREDALGRAIVLLEPHDPRPG